MINIKCVVTFYKGARLIKPILRRRLTNIPARGGITHYLSINTIARRKSADKAIVALRMYFQY